MEAVIRQKAVPFFRDERRNGDDVQILKTVGDEAGNEKWKRTVAVMEKDGQTTICWEEESGADAVRVNEAWGEISDGFIKKRDESMTVLPILPQSFEADWPMPRGKCPAGKCRVARLFSETIGGHQQRRTAAFR